MKNTFKYIAFGIALLASSFALNAQMGTYHSEGGMNTSKKVTGPAGGYYTITLESFATGETTVTETATPVDIVLVLDVSGSMDENLSAVTYTARDSQSYSYTSYGNNTYYYLYEGEYYQVHRSSGQNGTGGNNQRRLYFDVGNTRYWLTGTTVTTTQPSGVANGTTIWTGVLYESSQRSKMDALKEAVGLFVDAVTKNATEDSEGNSRRVDNRISIVKFAGHGNNNPAYYNGANQTAPSGDGNHRATNGYNYTEIVSGLTSVLDGGGATVKSTVTSLQAGGATAANGGMQLALNLISNIPASRESNKVVVMFTDGQPTYQSDFNTTVAGEAIGHAYTLKNSYSTTVYTIGVFDNETTNIKNYMNWVSSNYPNQQGWTNNGSTTTPTTGSYYQKSDGANLNDIFKDIASASAAADATAGASTQVRDVVSNSFILPSGDAAGITIKVADVKSDGTGWNDPQTATGVGYEITTVTTTTGEQHQQLMVTGFDYTKADTYNDAGFTVTPGNWVGERYTSKTNKYWAGKKLIIEFKVQANGEATGGDGTATNHPDSGIYVQEFNEDGSPKLDGDGNPIYHRVNKYDVPHTPLPVLIKIQKDGLRTGESATFQLMRVRPKGWNDEGTTLEEKMANVEYNAIGKPLPDLHDFDPIERDENGNPKLDNEGNPKMLDENDPMDYLQGIGWIDWSKVILTNKGADNAAILKTLYGLDPGWVYMVVEDDWGWAYELTGESTRETTSDCELNPFVFHNRARTVNEAGDPIVKHAEAVTINHFETLEGEGAYEEHYKSSKTNFQSK